MNYWRVSFWNARKFLRIPYKSRNNSNWAEEINILDKQDIIASSSWEGDIQVLPGMMCDIV